MKTSMPFLPDLGMHLRSRAGTTRGRVAGALMASSISRYRDEYYSVTGMCRASGVDFAATFDFQPSQWEPFADFVQRIFYLDVRLPQTEGHNVLRLEPSLPMITDFDVKPSEPTEAVETNETYAPLMVVRVNDVKLLPSSEAIGRRHDWWVARSQQFVEAMGDAGLRLCKSIKPVLTYDGNLEMEEFNRNLIACFFFGQILAEEPLEDVLGLMAERKWLTKAGCRQTETQEDELRRRLDRCADRLKHAHLNLLVWRIATLIGSQAQRGSIERELADLWGTTPSVILDQATYCLARPESLALPTDQIEDRILALVNENEGVQEIIRRRMNNFTKDVWQHPELKRLAPIYVRYDLIRQVHRAGQRAFIDAEMATRCEQNIKSIAMWLQMFATEELKLLESYFQSGPSTP